MSERKLSDNEFNQPLWETIRRFTRKRPILAVLFLCIGLLGIIIPIIPGLLFVFLAFAMFKRGWLGKFRRRFRFWKLEDPPSREANENQNPKTD